MIVALFGLAGVIVGALLSGLVSYIVESRREHKDAVVAARFVSEEIQMMQVDVEIWIQDRYVPETLNLRTDAWEQHNLALARTLPGPDWEMVAATYTWIHLLTTAPRPGEILEKDLDHYEAIKSEVIGGVKTLEPLVEGMRPKVPWRIRYLRRRKVRKAQQEAWS